MDFLLFRVYVLPVSGTPYPRGEISVSVFREESEHGAEYTVIFRLLYVLLCDCLGTFAGQQSIVGRRFEVYMYFFRKE